MKSFRLLSTASRRMMSSGVHQPSAVKPNLAETKSWSINPGLAVGIAGAGAFVAGMGIHVLSRGTSLNTEVEKASFGK